MVRSPYIAAGFANRKIQTRKGDNRIVAKVDRHGRVEWRSEEAAQFEPVGVVHIEQLRRNAADGSQPDDSLPLAPEVLRPDLCPRIEERYELPGFQAGDIWSFMQVAPMASEAEIGLIIGASMLPRDDVFDMEDEQRELGLR